MKTEHTINIYDTQSGELLAFYKSSCEYMVALITKSSYIINEAGILLTKIEII